MSHATLVRGPASPTTPPPPTVGLVGPADEVSPAWLAAFALGLAYSPRPEAARRIELQEVAGGSLDALRAAHARLLDTSVTEPALRLAALQLLRHAMRMATPAVPATTEAV